MGFELRKLLIKFSSLSRQLKMLRYSGYFASDVLIWVGNQVQIFMQMLQNQRLRATGTPRVQIQFMLAFSPTVLRNVSQQLAEDPGFSSGTAQFPLTKILAAIA